MNSLVFQGLELFSCRRKRPEGGGEREGKNRRLALFLIFFPAFTTHFWVNGPAPREKERVKSKGRRGKKKRLTAQRTRVSSRPRFILTYRVSAHDIRVIRHREKMKEGEGKKKKGKNTVPGCMTRLLIIIQGSVDQIFRQLRDPIKLQGRRKGGEKKGEVLGCSVLCSKRLRGFRKKLLSKKKQRGGEKKEGKKRGGI